ncbi:MAG: helix-turn-helix domain-containing protein, partial [Deltaproteobacteria bacterium]|nr:helix-turn-helix domain-containing protein [Deltaproteobacteria bacterium]
MTLDLAECDMPRMPITDEHGLHNYRVWLQTIFHERCRRNPAYSLRSFARSLGVSHPSLSQILSGKRPLTQKSAFVIANRLALPPNQRRQLLAQLRAVVGVAVQLSRRLGIGSHRLGRRSQRA